MKVGISLGPEFFVRVPLFYCNIFIRVLLFEVVMSTGLNLYLGTYNSFILYL